MRNIFESKILLVDDNRQLQELVGSILKREGFLYVDMADSVACAEGYFEKGQPDLVILDINLPDGDGFTLMQKIRTVSEVPVLFLSARDEDCDRLLGLGLGADDYMVKPFLPKELILRISAILKRTYFSRIAGMEEEKEEGKPIMLGKREIDFAGGVVRTKEGEIPLTAKEMAILKKLYDNRGNIVTFDTLCQTVWGDQYYGYENTVMVHIRRLREKIEENPSKPVYLLTARGLGYKLAKE